MTLRKFLIGSVALLLAALPPAAAQSKKQLEKDKARVEQEIKNLNSQLAKAKKNSRSGQQQLTLLGKKIDERTKLINNLDGQMNLLNLRMTATQDSIRLMRTQVDSLKVEYGKVVRRLYGERGNLDRLALVLDTRSYNLAYLRTRYFRDYSRYRRRQASFIRQKEEELGEATIELKRQQREKASLITQHQQQKNELAREQQQREKSLKDSKQKERDLQGQIAKKEKQKRQLQQQIQNIINEEIAKARADKKKKAQTVSNGKGGGNTVTTPTDPQSTGFAANKGRLPWPVSFTKVAREYGRYTHNSGGQNMNHGIDLICRSGAAVQCVAQGSVSRVFTCPNGTKGVIVRHGEYMTVYANLGSVSVREGAALKAGSNIGTVFTNASGQAEFSFQLWKGTSSLNPRQWLK